MVRSRSHGLNEEHSCVSKRKKTLMREIFVFGNERRSNRLKLFRFEVSGGIMMNHPGGKTHILWTIYMSLSNNPISSFIQYIREERGKRVHGQGHQSNLDEKTNSSCCFCSRFYKSQGLHMNFRT